MRRLLFASALWCAPLLGWAPAASADQNGIAVSDAWSRAAMVGRTGVIYLTITDAGAPDKLTGASTPVAATASLHETTNDNGVMKMRPVAAVPVQQGEPLTLGPGGYHIMLEGLKQPLQPGETFPVTLTFAHAGQIVATATVQKAGAGMAMDHGSMGGMDMGAAHPSAMPGMNMGGTTQH
jgi:periplasmic copper chaperone A